MEENLEVENNENLELQVSEEISTTENDDIQIANDVISTIAKVAVTGVSGVYAMAGGIVGGISEVLSGKKNSTKGIKVELIDKAANIDVNIIVQYGVRIPDVAFEIQNRVKKEVETMTGLTVSKVNIHVQGINLDSVSTQQD